MGAIREDKTDKINYRLIPPFFLKRLAKHLTDGAKRLSTEEREGEWNWLEGDEQWMNNCTQSLFRHTMQFMDGDVSEDHMSAIVCNLIFIEGIRMKLNGVPVEEIK